MKNSQHGFCRHISFLANLLQFPGTKIASYVICFDFHKTSDKDKQEKLLRRLKKKRYPYICVDDFCWTKDWLKEKNKECSP